jgi:hypothetical protein
VFVACSSMVAGPRVVSAKRLVLATFSITDPGLISEGSGLRLRRAWIALFLNACNVYSWLHTFTGKLSRGGGGVRAGSHLSFLLFCLWGKRGSRMMGRGVNAKSYIEING